MSRRTAERPSVVKSISGIVGVTLTVIVLVTCAANLRAKSTSPPNDQTAVTIADAAPTDVAGSLPINAGRAATDVVSEPAEPSGRITAGDGFIPADVTLSPFDVNQPAVGNLNPDLLAAIQQAATDAASAGIDIRINSGWRSARYQQQLLNQAVIKYGSEQEARKWVDTPEQSSHGAGNAVDISPTAADDWLLRHGSHYGLCQMYANEIWHFELAVAPGEHCPAPKSDASDG
jgi:hypothetical protein